MAAPNASRLERAFAESEASGRRFDLHPRRPVPIPEFDASNAAHAERARLCGVAEGTAARMFAALRARKLDAGQTTASKAVGAALDADGTMEAIRDRVRAVIPDQCEESP